MFKVNYLIVDCKLKSWMELVGCVSENVFYDEVISWPDKLFFWHLPFRRLFKQARRYDALLKVLHVNVVDICFICGLWRRVFFCQSQSHHLIFIFWIGILPKVDRLLHILNLTQMDNFRLETMINLMILTFKLVTSHFSVQTYPLLNRMAYS